MTKPVSEWTHGDLQALIRDQVQESLNLDYKRSASLDKTRQAKIGEMSKDVAAFANSDGGRIVYGIVEEGHLPVAVDDGVTDPTITREWIEQKLQSTIRPRVQGLIIRQIDLPEGGRSFVLDIPAATSLAPHMSEDNKYYRRYNFASVAMEDYEVKDAMRRAVVSDLYAQFIFSTPVGEGEIFKTKLNVTTSNHAIEPALYSSLNIMIENRLSPGLIEGFKFDLVRIPISETVIDATIYNRNLMVPHHQPIWKGKSWGMGSVDLSMKPGESYVIGWQLEWPGGWSHAWVQVMLDGNRIAVKEITPKEKT